MSRISGVTLAAAASRSQKNVGDFAGEFPGIKGYTDYREMLAEERPEWVSICAFPPDREEMALAALDAGARILLVEKPFAVSLAAARSIQKAAESRSARVFVNHQRRYGRWFEWMRDQLEQGAIGQLKSLTLHHPGSGFINFGPHLIDAALFFLGSRTAASLHAAVDWTGGGQYQGVRTEKYIVGDVMFADGVHLAVHSGPGLNKGQPCFSAAGSKGQLELHLGPFGPGTQIGRLVAGQEISPDFGTEHFHHNNTDLNLFYDRALADIWDAYTKGTPCRLDACHAAAGLDIILGLYASAECGARLTLPFAPDFEYAL